MSYKDIINGLQPIEYSRYSNITSYEKLMLYTALILEEKNVPFTFNYLCIAAFKLFPDKFCCDEEFREFPSVDRLNRTMMHLKYVKGKQAYLAGSIQDGYSFTSLGKQQALVAKAIIDGNKNVEILEPNKMTNIIDKHKSGFGKYKEFLESSIFKKYIETGKFDELGIYSFFGFSPFSQISYIKSTLKIRKEYAKDENNQECVRYIDKVLFSLQ